MVKFHKDADRGKALFDEIVALNCYYKKITAGRSVPGKTAGSPAPKAENGAGQRRLVKTGGLAESHLTRRLFGGMLRTIAPLPSSPAGYGECRAQQISETR